MSLWRPKEEVDTVSTGSIALGPIRQELSLRPCINMGHLRDAPSVEESQAAWYWGLTKYPMINRIMSFP